MLIAMYAGKKRPSSRHSYLGTLRPRQRLERSGALTRPSRSAVGVAKCPRYISVFGCGENRGNVGGRDDQPRLGTRLCASLMCDIPS